MPQSQTQAQIDYEKRRKAYMGSPGSTQGTSSAAANLAAQKKKEQQAAMQAPKPKPVEAFGPNKDEDVNAYFKRGKAAGMSQPDMKKRWQTAHPPS